MKIKFIRCSLILICCYVFVGCTRLNKIYEYIPASGTYEGGIVGAKLIGTFKSEEGLTTQGSPYRLLIWFEPNSSKNFKYIKMESLSLEDAKGEENYSISESSKEEFKKESSGKSRAYFSYKNISLEYAEYNLNIVIETEVDGLVSEEKLSLKFMKNYRKYRSNDFWDKLMSV